jgi:hypothetical protein
MYQRPVIRQAACELVAHATLLLATKFLNSITIN